MTTYYEAALCWSFGTQSQTRHCSCHRAHCCAGFFAFPPDVPLAQCPVSPLPEAACVYHVLWAPGCISVLGALLTLCFSHPSCSPSHLSSIWEATPGWELILFIIAKGPRIRPVRQQGLHNDLLNPTGMQADGLTKPAGWISSSEFKQMRSYSSGPKQFPNWGCIENHLESL